MTTAPAPAQTVSHYRLIELLGRGAMGEVWLAEDTQLPRKVAVKLLPHHLAEDRESVERLLREAQAAASVDHPAVVTVYEAGLADGRPFIVMQRVEGETLERRLGRGALPVDEALTLAIAIADALAEVHALGIVHRDLKPANIVMTARGPKVLDFGLAAVRGGPRLTQTGSALGTPLAMSPEQIRGLPPDNRSDLWALGVILYETITGVSPFTGASYEVVANRILNEAPRPPSALRPGIASDLDFIVLKLLRKDPAHRYARAEELIADLTNCEACAREEAATPTAPAPPPRLAVLYFEVLSAADDDAFLAAGLTEDLIVDLTRVEGVRVTSRAEVMPFRDRPLPPRTLARELGVEYLMQGSVRRAGNRARISAQLVRAADGHVLWGERFDRTLEDLFDVQAEVSKRIVDALQITLLPGEREMLDRAPTRDREAYAHFLRGRALLDENTRDASFAAEEWFKKGVERDPTFALAHAALGECYARRIMTWWAGMEAAEPAAAHAQRALALDPDLFEAHFVMAMVQRIKGQPAEMLAALEKVLAMTPDNAQALEWTGWSYMSLDRPEQGLPILEGLLARHPERYATASWIHQCYVMLGREEEAARALTVSRDVALEALRREPDSVHVRSVLAGNLADLGEQDQAIEQAERAVRAAPADGRIRYNAACVYAKVGMPDRAIAELKEGVRLIPTYIADWPLRDPDLIAVREHPEFVRMFGRAPQP